MIKKNGLKFFASGISLVSLLMLGGCNEDDGRISPRALKQNQANGSGDGSKANPDSETNGVSHSELGIVAFERSFLSSVVETASSTFNLNERLVEQNLVMSRPETSTMVRLTQDSRPPILEQFTQGRLGTTMTDTFSQSDLGILDIMVVIYNSGSMKEEQANLATKISPLLSSVKDSNWRIGVITTSKSQPNLRAIIQKGDANAAASFATAISAGIAGSGDERGIFQAVTGLSAPNFLRPGSSIAVLVVSDEDNCSTGPQGCLANDPDKDENYLLNYLKDSAKRPLGTNSRVYGLIYVPGDTTCKTAPYPGQVYANAATKSMGKVGSICAADYTQILNDISSDMAKVLDDSVTLKAIPDTGTVQVYINGALQTSGFTVMGKTVKFTKAPPVNSEIKITYVTGKTGTISDSFNLMKSVLPSSEQVLVNGNMIPNSSYTIQGLNPTVLKFATKPPEGADIRISYKESSELPKKFFIGLDVKQGTLVTKLNGVNATPAYDGASGMIEFATPPPEASSILVDFIKFGPPTLRYLIASLPPSVSGLKIKDVDTAAEVPGSQDGMYLVFDLSDFKLGRKLKATYRDESVRVETLPLSHMPIPNTVLVKPSIGSCSEVDSFIVKGNSIELSCLTPDDQKVVIDYRYADKVTKVFKMLDSGDCEGFTWSVFVNDVETKQFTANGCSIQVDSELPFGSKVKVRS